MNDFAASAAICQLILKRKSFLEELEQHSNQVLKGCPEGNLRISKSRGRIQYYHRLDKEDTNGIYISSKNREFAAQLAEKDYYQKILKSLHKEYGAITRFLADVPHPFVEDIYGQLSEQRRDLVTPIIETDEQYLARWKSISYPKLEYPDASSLYPSDQGETVRSKSELIIANELFKDSIPYRYEAAVRLKGYGTVYPDFTILNLKLRKEIIWEHLGMLDDAAYLEKNLRKINAYIMNGYYPGDGLILTAETRECPLNLQVVRMLIDRFCR